MSANRKTRRGGITGSELERAAQRLAESEAAGGAGPAAAGLNFPSRLQEYYDMMSTGKLSWHEFQEAIESGFLEKYNLSTLRKWRHIGAKQRRRSMRSRSSSSQRPPSERKALTRKQRNATIAAQAEADRLERETMFAAWKIEHPEGSRSEFNVVYPPYTKEELKRRRQQALENAMNL